MLRFSCGFALVSLVTALGCTTDTAVTGREPDAAAEINVPKLSPRDTEPGRPAVPSAKLESPDLGPAFVTPPRSEADAAARGESPAPLDAARPDGNRADAETRDTAIAPPAPLPVGKPVLIAVGYQGRRVVSRDLGATWIGGSDFGRWRR